MTERNNPDHYVVNTIVHHMQQVGYSNRECFEEAVDVATELYGETRVDRVLRLARELVGRKKGAATERRP